MLTHLRDYVRGKPRIRSVCRRTRALWYRWRYGLKGAHPTSIVEADCVISPDLVAGAYSYVGPGCRIGPKVEVGPYSMLGPQVMIVGGDHKIEQVGVPMVFSGRPNLLPTVIEADSWIGARAVILAGVRIGRGAVVGAGAVVTRSVPPYEIHGGVPARKIGERFPPGDSRDVHDRMLNGPPRSGEYCEPKGIVQMP